MQTVTAVVHPESAYLKASRVAAQRLAALEYVDALFSLHRQFPGGSQAGGPGPDHYNVWHFLSGAHLGYRNQI